MAIDTGGSTLVFGGTTPTGASNSVFELDYYNDAWTMPRSLDTARTGGGVGQTGQLGPFNSNGYKYSSDIFLFGGKGSSQSSSTSSVENYGWTNDEGNITGPDMSVAGSAFAYASDPTTGDLYAIGGLNGTSNVLSSAERYDPSTDSWSAIAPLPTALYATAGATDGFGHIFVFGGAQATTGAANSTVYRYTIATNTWDTLGAMPVAVRDGSAVAAPDGLIYFIGGKSAGGAIANVESYNPGNDTWTDETPLPAPVYGAAVAVDYNDNLNVIGGFDSAGAPTANVYTTPIAPGLVAPYTPTITLDNTWLTYDAAPQGVTASAVGIDGVTPVDGSIDITYNGSSDAPTNAGTYNVLATFTSNDPNYLSTVIAGQLQISPATPTINITGGGTVNYDFNPHPISAAAIGVDGSTSVDGAFAYTYNGSTTAPVGPGTFTAVATFTSSDANYSNASATTTITIPDATIPTGVTAVGASTTTVELSWNPVTIAPVTYNIRERHVTHSPKGSLVTITYPIIASGLTSTSASIYVGTSFAGSTGHTFYVTSVDDATGVESAKSEPASATSLYAPSLYGAMTMSGAVVSSLYAPVGEPIQITLLSYGNEKPTYSIQNGPSGMSVDPNTGVVTYIPSMSDTGTTVRPTFVATNSVGASTYSSFAFTVLLPADANYDNVVNTSDFVPVAAHFNQAGLGFASGDFNGDGVVNALDFNILASSFGMAAPIVASQPLVATATQVAVASSVPSLFGDQAINPSPKDVIS